jgi:hypothetical protein
MRLGAEQTGSIGNCTTSIWKVSSSILGQALIIKIAAYVVSFSPLPPHKSRNGN